MSSSNVSPGPNKSTERPATDPAPEEWGDWAQEGQAGAGEREPAAAQPSTPEEPTPTDEHSEPSPEPVPDLQPPPARGRPPGLWIRLASAIQAALGRARQGTSVIPLPPTRNVAIFGPIASGKTATIVALDLACALGRTGTNRLTFQPFDANRTEELGQGAELGDTEDIIRHGVDALTERNQHFRATADARAYPFTIRGQVEGDRRRPAIQFEVSGAFWDGPGGGLFPPKGQIPHSSRDALLQQGRSADALVFCFDVNQRWHELLSARLHDALRGLSRQGVLRARRVLILLNKVDLLAERVASHQRRAVSPVAGGALTARDYAQRIDPVAQGLEVLGQPQLSRFRSYMAPDATLAIGLCSTSGFTPEGGILLNAGGRPVRRDSGAHLDNNEFLNQWRPFGVHEAILFLGAGIATGPVGVVHDDTLANHARPSIHVSLPLFGVTATETR